MLAARRADRLAEVARAVEDRGGAGALRSDRRDGGAEVEALFAAAVARFGRVDQLVNCAGVPQATPTERMSAAEWRMVLDAT